MSVGAVRFGNTGVSSFQDMISQPPVYAKQNKPNAATVIYKEKPQKKGNPLVKVMVGAAVVAGALALGVKNKEAIKASNIYKSITGNEEIATFLKKDGVQKVIGGAKKVGETICKYTGTAVNFVKSKLPQAKAAVEQAAKE